MVQCKRYTKGSSLGRTELNDGIIWAKSENPQYYLVITTSVISSPTRDWLNSIRKQVDFKIELIERVELENLTRQYAEQLQHCLPADLYHELTIPGYTLPKKTTLLEDLFSEGQVSDDRPLKDRIFAQVVLPRNTRIAGPIYGQSVMLEEDCTVDGHIYARRHVRIGERSSVKGTILCPGSIELVNGEVDEVCGSQVTMHGPCIIHGSLVAERDLDIPPDSKVSYVLCSGSRLNIGERSEIGDVVAKGETQVMPGAHVRGVLRCPQVILRSPTTIEWIATKGNVLVPNGASVNHLATEGSVVIDSGSRVTRIHTARDVEVSADLDLKEITCKNLLISSRVSIDHLRASGNVVVKYGDSFKAKLIDASGDVSLPSDALVDIITAKGDVALGHRCRVKLLAARNLKALDHLSCSVIICKGSVELGEECSIDSLQAVRDIQFKRGLQSSSWTIFSQRGRIRGEGMVTLGNVEVSADDSLPYKGSTILTALTERDQLELIGEPTVGGTA